MASKHSLDALKAAYYSVYDSALTQEQIAVQAGLGTQAQVSRLLKEAREQKVIREVFRFPADLPAEEPAGDRELVLPPARAARE